VNLSIGRGEVVLITGRSGAGKSTLLAILGGLGTPTTGHVRFEGRSLDELSGREVASLRRARIGFVFQNFNLLTSWSAFENVEAPLLRSRMPKLARRERVAALLNRVGLAEKQANLPSELSEGEQQRIALARALVNEPALVLADEPTGDLDPETATDVLGLLLAAPRERGTALLVVSHGLFPAEVADRAYRLEDGKLVSQAGRNCAG